MTFVVAFDGSPLAEAALVRATEYADVTDESVLAVSVIPERARYARERGWLADDEEFDARAIAADLHERVVDLAPSSSFRSERIGTSAPGAIASRIRTVAKEEDASVVFVGSENAGRLVIPITSVGGAVAADATYDVHLVRRRVPPTVRGVEPKSDFYLPGDR